jgi:hypothetical protein
MLQTSPRPFAHARPAPRQAIRPPIDLRIRTVRPSLLDLRFSGDAWIVDRDDGTVALCLGDYCLTRFQGVALDLPALNSLFNGMRHRRPRRRCAAAAAKK